MTTGLNSNVDLKNLRVAIVHHWFMQRRGAERVVEVIAESFPQADIFTLIYNPDVVAPELKKHKFTTSFLQRVPGGQKLHRYMMPLYPFVLEQFNLDDYDLVISSESGPSKGVITGARTCHICYCETPMRYIWDMYHAYRAGKGLGRIARAIFTISSHYMRLWDLATASRVDYFLANSENVAARIRKHYRRDATVMYCPVHVSNGYLAPDPGDYYLMVGALVSYKRVDLAVQACNRLKRPLRIVGLGEELEALRRMAGPTVQVLGYQTDEQVRELYANCRAVLFPGEEDFGIVPVEANSYGRPVIAFGRGGALETLQGFFPGEDAEPEACTGVFFEHQTEESLREAIETFERVENRFSPSFLQAHSRKFDARHFKAALEAYVTEKVAEFRNNQIFAARRESRMARTAKETV